MKCPTCKRAMVELFHSAACDWCDYGPKREHVHRGFAVVPQTGLLPNTVYYVFRTLVDAGRWMEALVSCGVPTMRHEVWSIEPFRWRMMSCNATDVVYADHTFELFPDHRYEPLPHRAFIAPVRKETV